jgi:transaldolase
MSGLDQLNIKLFCDGADFKSLLTWSIDQRIQGFTTNPTLMRKSSVVDYEAFARQLLKIISDRPVSFGVLADDLDVMEEEALAIAAWGENVYVNIPVTNSWGASTARILHRLSRAGVRLNVTAVLTLGQLEYAAANLDAESSSIISIFGGHIADTGVDPVPLFRNAARILQASPGIELLWASPRELLNIFQAEDSGCDIITLSPEILNKLNLIGKDLNTYSLETVTMLHRDACTAGYQIQPRKPMVPELASNRQIVRHV